MNKRGINLLNIILLSTCLFWFMIMTSGCGNQTSDKTTQDQKKEESLQLNNGIKWDANDETTQGIKKMMVLLSEFEESTNNTDYDLLQTELDNELNLIFKNCTMQGPAHDQLHHYLIPLKELINKLGEHKGETTTITELDDYLQLYFEYFN